jgi:hypothetical protein
VTEPRDEPRPVSAGSDETGRPGSLMAVYLWDAVLALLAILGALAPFGGAIIAGGRTVDIPGLLQVLLAVQGAAYAASVIIVMIFLTRRFAWVRMTQIVVLVMAIAFAVVSLGVEQLAHHDVDPATIPSGALVVLIDLTVLFLLTAPKLRAWYVAPGRVPSWVRGTIALWVAGSVAVIVANALV